MRGVDFAELAEQRKVTRPIDERRRNSLIKKQMFGMSAVVGGLLALMWAAGAYAVQDKAVSFGCKTAAGTLAGCVGYCLYASVKHKRIARKCVEQLKNTGFGTYVYEKHERDVQKSVARLKNAGYSTYIRE